MDAICRDQSSCDAATGRDAVGELSGLSDPEFAFQATGAQQRQNSCLIFSELVLSRF